MTKVALPESPEEEEGFTTPLQPHTILLKDDETIATMYPIPCDPALFPKGLLKFIHEEFNMEIAKGSSFPYYETLDESEFQDIWFHQDGHLCIMVLGELPELDYSATNSQTDLQNNYGTEIRTARHQNQYLTRKKNKDFQFLQIQWEKQCLGVFSLQPAFPGRSSHIATGNFLVNAGIRGKGIGKTLASTYLDWATHLGFTCAYFPLVYGTNVGMRRIFEELNFTRVGMIPASGILKGYDVPIDSFIYQKELTSVSKTIAMFQDIEATTVIGKYERMVYYMKHKRYPKNCDKTEKARIRMQSKHHTIENGKIMFNGKEVIFDPIRQKQIAAEAHSVEHGGINKVCKKINLRYHWKGVKKTVVEAAANCKRCKQRFMDETGVIVTPDGNVKQAHMLPDHNINAEDLVRLTNKKNNKKNSKDNGGSDKPAEMDNNSRISDAAGTIRSESTYEGVITPKDNNNNNNFNGPENIETTITPTNVQRTRNSSGNEDDGKKRTYETAVLHGMVTKSKLNHSGSYNNNNNVYANSISIHETLDRNLRRLNKIVDEEVMKKRPRRAGTNDDSMDALYSFNKVQSISNKLKGRSTGREGKLGKDNNKNNNDNDMLNLDSNGMNALKIGPGKDGSGHINNTGEGDESIHNGTNIPLIFDFGDDYLEEEDEDYEEPEPTSTIGHEGVEEEDDDDDEDGEEMDFADQLEELSIQHELQSLQNLGDDELDFQPTRRH